MFSANSWCTVQSVQIILYSTLQMVRSVQILRYRIVSYVAPYFSMAALSWAIRVGCGMHLFHSYVYEFTETFGESMLPTLNYAGDYVHANKLYSRGRNIQLGDMVVAVKPTDPSQRVCKRVTGMPGDYVLVDPSSGDFAKYIQVPKGHCWLTGDNLTHSLDSRSYGALPLGLIRGKIFAITAVDGTSRWAPSVVNQS